GKGVVDLDLPEPPLRRTLRGVGSLSRPGFRTAARRARRSRGILVHAAGCSAGFRTYLPGRKMLINRRRHSGLPSSSMDHERGAFTLARTDRRYRAVRCLSTAAIRTPELHWSRLCHNSRARIIGGGGGALKG